jgi:hypothetical protein
MELDEQIALRMARARIQAAIHDAELRRAVRATRGSRSLRRRLGAALLWLGHRMQD